jgi:hypothetical protein
VIVVAPAVLVTVARRQTLVPRGRRLPDGVAPETVERLLRQGLVRDDSLESEPVPDEATTDTGPKRRGRPPKDK